MMILSYSTLTTCRLQLVMPAPRVSLGELPEDVAVFCSEDRFERALHSRGCSFVDQLKNL